MPFKTGSHDSTCVEAWNSVVLSENTILPLSALLYFLFLLLLFFLKMIALLYC